MKALVSSVLAACLVLSGCAGVVRTDNAGDKKYSDVKAAKLDTKAIGEVNYGDFKNIKISANSPSIDSASLKGRYEVVSVHGEKDKSFEITVAGICDCLGFRKWSIVPFSYLVDEAGNTVSTGKFAAPNVQLLSGSFPADGNYYVLIVADSTSAGRRVGEVYAGLMSGGVYKPDAFAVSMTSHPTGIVQVNWPKK
jgi:hypothetical protein